MNANKHSVIQAPEEARRPSWRNSMYRNEEVDMQEEDMVLHMCTGLVVATVTHSRRD